MQFRELIEHQILLENLAKLGFTTPTPVQEAAIPAICRKQDVVLQSHTGSGKTAAFGLPLLQFVNASVPATQYVVLVPTRELAMQVTLELNRLAEGTGLQAVTIYGGASMQGQIESLRRTPQLVVGTPGRILDHLKRRTLNFSVARGIVLDEADKMLSMGFLPEVGLIFRHLPKKRQVIMSSATFPFTIERLIQSYMHEPARIDVSSDSIVAREVRHFFCLTPHQSKDQVLLAFLEREQPDQSLIFCNTKIEVKALTQYLVGAGLRAMSLSSELTQKARERNLLHLRSGLINHLVCTDVAARGIDIPNLSHVFIYTASEDLETYVHRTGRTGRAGRAGVAISLISGQDLADFNMALKVNDILAQEIQAPSEEEILRVHLARKREQLEAINFALDADIPKEFTELAESLTPEQARSVLPLLLETFFRSEAGSLPEAYEPPQEVEGETVADPEAGAPERGEGRFRGRDRGRDRGSLRSRDGERGRERERPGRSGGRGADSSGAKPAPRRQDGLPAKGDFGSAQGSHGQADLSLGWATLCLGLGTRDGLNLADVRFVLTKFAKLQQGEIGRIEMGEHESLVNIPRQELAKALMATGRHYRNLELVLAESSQALAEA
jgi:ATP-dependent RNA helicase DeaD